MGRIDWAEARRLGESRCSSGGYWRKGLTDFSPENAASDEAASPTVTPSSEQMEREECARRMDSAARAQPW